MKDDVVSRFVILPSLQKLAWDCMMGFLIMYSVISVPLKIGFEIRNDLPLAVLDAFVDVLFGIDMIITFFTAIEDDGKLIAYLPQIARLYVTSWFFVDLVSTIPFDKLMPLLFQGLAPSLLRSIKLIRVLRLFRLLKIFRIIRLTRKMKESRMNEAIHPIVFSMAGLMSKIFLCAHILGCMFYQFSDCLNNEYSDWQQCGNDTLKSKYILSMYWTFVTMLGVGYGDVVLTTEYGRLYSVFVMVVGSIVFGFIVATIADSVKNLNPRDTAKKFKMDQIREYVTEKKLTKHLKSAVWRHYEYFYNKSSSFPEDIIIESMPVMLQHLVLESTRGNLGNLKLFRKQDFGTLCKALSCLKPMFVSPMEAVIHESDYVVDMFFVVRGTMHAYMQNRTTDNRQVLVGIFGDGSDFGMIHALRCSDLSWATYRANVITDLMWLSYSNVKIILDNHATLRKTFEKRAENESQAIAEVSKYISKSKVVSNLRVPSYIMCDGEVISCQHAIKMLGEGLVYEKSVKIYKTVKRISVTSTGKEIYEDNQETTEQMWDRWVINPNAKYKIYFDLFIAMISMMCLITIPYRIGFGIGFSMSWYVIDIITECSFFVDMVLSFLTAYEQSDFSLHTAHSNIAKKYLKSWFIVDFFSTVPFYRLGVGPSGAFLLRALRALKVFRLFRVLKLLRLFRVLKILQYFFSGNSLNSDRVVLEDVFTRIAKLLGYLALITHVIACFWAWVSLNSSDDSWYHAAGIRDEENVKKYIAAVYWSYATMATVGYGDIYARNDDERIYSIVVMVAGSNILAYIVGTVGAHAFDRTGSKGLQETKLGLIRDYLAEQGTPKSLREATIRHFCYVLENKTPFQEVDIWKNLPHALRHDTIFYGNKNNISKIPILDNIKESVASVIYSLCDLCFVVEGSYIYNFETGSGGVYFILNGTAEVVDDGEDDEDGEVVIAEIKKGFFFGHENLFERNIDFVGIRAKTDLCMLWISNNSLSIMKHDLPYAFKIFRDQISNAYENLKSQQTDQPFLRKHIKVDVPLVEAEFDLVQKAIILNEEQGKIVYKIKSMFKWAFEETDDVAWIRKKAIRSKRNSFVGINLRKSKPSEVLSHNGRDRYNEMKRVAKLASSQKSIHPLTIHNRALSQDITWKPSGRNAYANLYGSEVKRVYSPRYGIDDVEEDEEEDREVPDKAEIKEETSSQLRNQRNEGYETEQILNISNQSLKRPNMTAVNEDSSNTISVKIKSKYQDDEMIPQSFTENETNTLLTSSKVDLYSRMCEDGKTGGNVELVSSNS